MNSQQTESFAIHENERPMLRVSQSLIFCMYVAVSFYHNPHPTRSYPLRVLSLYSDLNINIKIRVVNVNLCATILSQILYIFICFSNIKHMYEAKFPAI